MNLKNWEIEAVTGAAITGATVQAYVASDTHPNPGSPVASTSTNLSGMWELTGLADGVTYDIKVTTGSRVKWYKGNTKHNIGHMYDDTTPDPNRNLLANGGQDSWVERGTGAIALPTADPGTPNTADGWTTYIGSGDSGTAQLDTGVVSTNSKGSTKIVYNRSGGQLVHYRDIPDVVWQGLKGLTVSVSAQVENLTASSELRVVIDDGVGTTVGPVVSGLNAYLTASASRVLSASATRVRVSIQTNRVDTGSKTFYIDNVMMDITSVPPVYAPEPDDITLVPTQARTVIVEAAPSGDNYTLAGAINALAHRVMGIVGAAGVDWKDAIPRSLTQLLADVALKVAKSGDTMTGNLNMGTNKVITSGAPRLALDLDAGAADYGIGVNPGELTLVTNGLFKLRIGSITGTAFQIWSAFTQGTGSGMDSDMVDGKHASDLILKAGDSGIGNLNLAGAKRITIPATGLQIDLDGGAADYGIGTNSGELSLVTSGALRMRLGTIGGTAYDIITALNIASQSVSSATTAGTATNATQLGGIAAASYALLPSTGVYVGNNGASRTINLGFQPSYVLITSPDVDPGAGITGYLCHLVSTTVARNFQLQIFPGSGTASSAVMSASALAASGFVVDNFDGNNVSGITYNYVAFR